MIHIIGIGNEWASDDGIGPMIARRLEERLAKWTPRPSFRVFTLASPDVALIELMDGCDALVVVDAVTTGGAPGTVHILEWRSDAVMTRGVERASSHGIGVREALELAAVLGKLPPTVLLLGIEIASAKPERGFSPALEAALPEILAGCEKAIRRRLALR